jgi:hypothetical protein
LRSLQSAAVRENLEMNAQNPSFAGGGKTPRNESVLIAMGQSISERQPASQRQDSQSLANLIHEREGRLRPGGANRTRDKTRVFRPISVVFQVSFCFREFGKPLALPEVVPDFAAGNPPSNRLSRGLCLIGAWPWHAIHTFESN